jgi:GT2 family glycosyltransferase
MKVSVIIPTYNGADKLPVILPSLAKQTHQDFEVVVVVDGSTDNTMSVLEDYKHLFSDINIVRQKNLGRATVRNTGARVAKGDLLVLFDDDLCLDPHCLTEHINHHLKYPSSILTGGLKNPEQKKSDEFFKLKEYFNKRWNSSLIENGYQPLNKDNYFVMAANFSLSKQLFNRLEGFDERLNDAEDFDFGTRALEEGIPMYFNINASAIHNESPTVKQYINRLNQYRTARKQLLQVKPHIYLRHEKINVEAPKGGKKLFFKFFRSEWWIDSIETQKWVWLPEKVRFKLYDYIITANTIF